MLLGVGGVQDSFGAADALVLAHIFGGGRVFTLDRWIRIRGRTCNAEDRRSAKEPLGAEQRRQLKSRWLGQESSRPRSQRSQAGGKQRRSEQRDEAVPMPAESPSSCLPRLPALPLAQTAQTTSTQTDPHASFPQLTRKALAL